MRRLRRAHQKHAREQAKRRKKFKQRALAVGTAAAITLGTAAGLSKALAHTPDPHELPVSQDADADLLTDTEEVTLGYCPFNPDQNRNEIPDGVDLAKRCSTAIEQLPWQNEADPEETYKWWAPQYGLHTCDICGATMAMGSGGVVNPRLGISVDFPFRLTLHFMEHGSFSYLGYYGTEPVEGRVDIPLLVQALELSLPFDPNAHQLPVAKDADADLLANKEEFAIGYQPFDDDQNKNEIPDGVELAKRSAEVIDQLPQIGPEDPPPNGTYKVEHQARGNENCCICGIPINMGTMEIINPPLGLRVEFPILSLHYMGHGSFSYDGTTNTGRTNVPLLLRTLELRFPYYPDDHQLPVDGNDLDGDLLTNGEELAAGYNLYDPDQDQDLTPDGIELARQCGEVIDALPVHDPYDGNPAPEQTYKINCFLKGLEQCGICGAMRNMGSWLVVNPKIELSIRVPDIVCHYIEHGSFSYAGDVHGRGRIDVPLLVKILEMPRRCGDLGTIYLPGDLNQDCEVNFKDFAEFTDKWLDSNDPNQNASGKP